MIFTEKLSEALIKAKEAIEMRETKGDSDSGAHQMAFNALRELTVAVERCRSQSRLSKFVKKFRDCKNTEVLCDLTKKFLENTMNPMIEDREEALYNLLEEFFEQARLNPTYPVRSSLLADHVRALKILRNDYLEKNSGGEPEEESDSELTAKIAGIEECIDILEERE